MATCASLNDFTAGLEPFPPPVDLPPSPLSQRAPRPQGERGEMARFLVGQFGHSTSTLFDALEANNVRDLATLRLLTPSDFARIGIAPRRREAINLAMTLLSPRTAPTFSPRAAPTVPPPYTRALAQQPPRPLPAPRATPAPCARVLPQ